MKIPKIEIAKGVKIPQVGLGLWLVRKDEDVERSVGAALEAGYRHFDTAQIYGNEGKLAKALEDHGIKREDVFITTKIWLVNFAPLLTIPSFHRSLKRLKTDYVDLLLLHFPVTLLRNHAWKELEKIHQDGGAKAIGVSNFTVKHLKELLANCDVVPAVNQVELHVYLQQPELVEYCREQGIVLEAYSPLAHGYGMDNPVLQKLADKYDKTTAQIMLRWCVEQGAIVLPKSKQADRVLSNIDIFDFKLDDTDMAELKGLDSDHRTCWDPTHVI
jgi:diketogulonate reductase-like aldo/keto reductase